MQRFIDGTEGISAEKVFGHNVAQTYNRRQMLVFQFVKLLNYFSDDLVPEWGGSYIATADVVIAPVALDVFLQWSESDPDSPWWIDKRFDNQPWGPKNCQFVISPPKLLGAPYEAYLSLDGSMTTINQAARMLCVDAGVLVGLKLKLLYDELVVLEAIKRLLLPRPTWPRIAARQGGRGRTFRFAKK